MNPPVQKITSLTNDRIKELVRLRKRRERDRRGLVIIEDALVIRRALAARYPLQTLFFCPGMVPGSDRDLLEALLADPGLQHFEVTAPVMAKAAYREDSDGLLVLAGQVKPGLEDLVPARGGPPLLVVLEGVEKPGNLGAVQRVADGAGADGVIVCGGGTDPFNPNALRASRGACFTMPTVQATTGEAIRWLKSRGIRLIAASPEGGRPWDGVDLAGPAAIILGTEHDGLSPESLAAADLRVTIPMLGRGDSLNVSTSAAIILYEAVRRRRAG
ncbi:RNA methyltransferase [bacterium]|nr:RNA methyltransferase [bacterium]